MKSALNSKTHVSNHHRLGERVKTRSGIHQIQVTAELHAGINLLLLDNGVLLLGALALLLPRHNPSVRSISSRSVPLALDLRVRVLMPVRVVVPRAAGRDPEPLVHGDEDHEPDQDAQTQEQVAVGLDEHQADALGLVLAEEDLGEQVEEGVAQQAADGKGHHDGEGRRVDVGRAEREQEIRRAGDVQGREEGVDGGGAGEEDGEEARGQRGRSRRVFGVFGGIELLDDGAGLYNEELLASFACSSDHVSQGKLKPGVARRDLRGSCCPGGFYRRPCEHGRELREAPGTRPDAPVEKIETLLGKWCAA